ncbi:MAG TPA: putative leader peptide [Streptomyces sp.]
MSASGWAVSEPVPPTVAGPPTVSESVPLTTRRHIDLKRIAGALCPGH